MSAPSRRWRRSPPPARCSWCWSSTRSCGRAVRFATGFCFAGLFTIMESWLNSGVSNKDRARVLALYRIIDIGSVTGAQFMIPVFGAGGFTIFAIMSMMITLSLVPVSLGDRSNPAPPEEVGLDLGAGLAHLAARPASAASPSASPTAPSARCRRSMPSRSACRSPTSSPSSASASSAAPSSSTRSAICPTAGTGARYCW